MRQRKYQKRTKIFNKNFLFGSYGWGDGEWMRPWESDVKESGSTLGAAGLISNGDDSQIDSSELEAFVSAINA